MTAFLFGLIGLLIILPLSAGVILLEKKRKIFRTPEWEWIAQILASVFTIAIGFSLYFLQEGISQLIQKNSIKHAVTQELRIIQERLVSVNEQATECSNSDGAALMINPYLLPDMAVRKAIDSLIFPSNYMNHFMRLQYLVDDHNRWAEFGFKIMTDPTNPNAFAFAKVQQNWIEIDNQIKAQVIFILECLELGASPTAGDADCI